MLGDLSVGLLSGLLQGVLEWLPVSSQGAVALAASALGATPERALAYGLFVHAGTALSATVYFRRAFADVFADAPAWRPGSAWSRSATLTFLVVATISTGVVAVLALRTIETAVTAPTGGGFLAAVGGALVLTGLVLGAGDRAAGAGADAAEVGYGARDAPDAVDAVVVGLLQGLAVLPGVSRSGVTTGALLLRGHSPAGAFRLSFLLSVPAAVGAAAIGVAAAGGLPVVSPTAATLALVTAAVVGYATVDVLLRAARRLPFPAICVGLGSLAVVGGVVAAVG
jgi:undecaprenyl-diphosphatase